VTRRIARADVKDLVAYERVREQARADVIALKRGRRVALGQNLTLLFENRETVLFQIQEMVRTERIVDDAKIQDEIDAYAALLAPPGELSATLFIEIPELVRMSQDQVRETVNRFQGLDREGVVLVLDGERVPARFESGHSKEEKMAAVHYLRFAVPEALRDLDRRDARLRVEHPHYRAETPLAPALRQALEAELRG
jgi:hypothetical protein